MASLPYRSCVGVVLANSQNKVFAGQRIDSDFMAWQMPQGGIDEGEASISAALRELEEETGIPPCLVKPIEEFSDWLFYDLPAELVPKLWGGKFRGQKQKWWLFRFLGSDADVNIATAEPEFSEWQWLSQEEVVANAVSFKVEIYRRVFAAFSRSLSA